MEGDQIITTLSQITPISHLDQNAVQKTQSSEFKITLSHKLVDSKIEVKPKAHHWTPQQDKIYIQFLEEYGQYLRYQSVRRQKHIFRVLSQKMHGKRTPTQCKSHHQKMKTVTKKGTIKEILAYVRQKILLRQKQENQRLRAQKPTQQSIVDRNEEFQVTYCTQGVVKIKIQTKLMEAW